MARRGWKWLIPEFRRRASRRDLFRELLRGVPSLILSTSFLRFLGEVISGKGATWLSVRGFGDEKDGDDGNEPIPSIAKVDGGCVSSRIADESDGSCDCSKGEAERPRSSGGGNTVLPTKGRRSWKSLKEPFLLK